MAHTTISIEGHLSKEGAQTNDKKHLLRCLAELLRGIAVGACAFTRVRVEHSAVKATGTLTISSGSGTVGVTINGITVSRAWAGSDNATAGLLATDINARAEAIINQHVEATATNNVVTMTAKVPGHAGNAVSIAATGTGASVSGVRLTGGTSTERLVIA